MVMVLIALGGGDGRDADGDGGRGTRGVMLVMAAVMMVLRVEPMMVVSVALKDLGTS